MSRRGFDHRGFELSQVAKTYGRAPVLTDVSFAIEPGWNTALLGASGCGKSTVLRLLAGLDTPSAGTVSLGGEVVDQPGRTTVPPHQRGVSMVFQDLALWPNLSVLDNVRLGLSGLGLTRKECARRARAALDLCATLSLESARPGRISGGEQQRAALARALAVEPKYLLLDEPFSGLDLATKERLLEDIRDLAGERDITIVLVTHDPIEASALCGRAVVLAEGVVAEAGTWRDVLGEPRSKILRLFAGHMKACPDEPPDAMGTEGA